jgi:hypothetical protein
LLLANPDDEFAALMSGRGSNKDPYDLSTDLDLGLDAELINMLHTGQGEIDVHADVEQ